MTRLIERYPMPVVHGAYNNLDVEYGSPVRRDIWGAAQNILLAKSNMLFAVTSSGVSEAFLLGSPLEHWCPSTKASADPIRHVEAVAVETAPAASSMVYELRRLSGLSWDQLGRMLGVSRRTVHHWAAGGEIGPKNHERLGNLLAVMRFIDRGAASENRKLLLGPVSSGPTVFELLRNQAFARVREMIGSGPGRATGRWAPVDLDRIAVSGPQPLRTVVETADSGAEDDRDVQLATKARYRRLKVRRK
jgi:DNA-binding transcriptional regulator YiaG